MLNRGDDSYTLNILEVHYYSVEISSSTKNQAVYTCFNVVNTYII